MVNFLQRRISREPSTRVVSIRNSVTDLERCQENLDVVLECYRSVISDLAECTIQVDDDKPDPIRKKLAAIADEVRFASPNALPEYGITIRELLHEHAGNLTAHVADIQLERTKAERALQELSVSHTQSDGDHDGRIRRSVDNLRSLARSPGARAVGEMLRNAADSIEQSVEQIRRQNQITNQQFHNEIRALNRRIDPSAADDQNDSLTRVLNRAESQEKILSSTPGEFQLVLVRVRGLRLAELQFGPDVAAQLASAFVVRLRNTLPYNTSIARWGEEEFIGLISGPPSGTSTSAFSRSIGENLPRSYACVHNGKDVRLSLEFTVCVVDGTARDTPQQVLERTETSMMRI